MATTTEEQLIEGDFEAFDRHDIDAVMVCFHEYPVIVGMDGARFKGGGAASLRGPDFALP